MSGEHLRHHVSDDGAVHTLTMDKQPGNVIDIALCRELAAALPEAAGEPDAKVLVLRGAGKNFCFGASVEEHLPETAPAMLRAVGDVVRGLIRFPYPTIAGIQGRCLGGGLDLALSCGIVIAEDEAILGAPEIRLGVFPPPVTALLMGRAAEEVILTGTRPDRVRGPRPGHRQPGRGDRNPRRLDRRVHRDAFRLALRRFAAHRHAGGAGGKAPRGRATPGRRRGALRRRAAGASRRIGRNPGLHGKAPAAMEELVTPSGGRALVSGGQGGIGRATVAALAADGHVVVVADLDGSTAPPGAVEAIGCDLRDPAACVAAVEQAATTLGGLTVLVHSAGITRDRVTWKLTPEDWDAVMAVNLDAAFHLTRAAIPIMRENGGGAFGVRQFDQRRGESSGRAPTPPPRPGSTGWPRPWPARWDASGSGST